MQPWEQFQKAPTAKQPWEQFGGKPQEADQNIIEKIGSSPLGNAVGDVISGTGDVIKNIPNQNPASSGLQLVL